MKKYDGILIAIEGISGVGKTTFASMLAQNLLMQDIDVQVLGGFNICGRSTDITKFCRSMVDKVSFFDFPLISEIHLLLSEMSMDIEKNVKPLLSNGAVILYDNYIQSILAVEAAIIYQNFFDDECNDYIKYLNSLVNNYVRISNMPMPQWTVYLKCSIDEIAVRLEKRDRRNVSKKQKMLLKAIGDEYSHILNKNNTIIARSTNSINQEENSSYKQVTKFIYKYIIKRRIECQD